MTVVGEYQYEVARRRVEAETEYEYIIGMAQRQLEALGVAPQLVASSQSPKRRRGEEVIISNHFS